MNNATTLAVWGCGYIGFSNLVFYGRAGQKCIGLDIDPSIKERVLAQKYKEDLLRWMNLEYLDLFQTGIIDITTDPSCLDTENEVLHLLCVPTEKHGMPDMAPLFAAVENIIYAEKRSGRRRANIVIESTLVPGTAQKVFQVLQDAFSDRELYFGVAPRRDWFLDSDRNLSTLTRVIGANCAKALEYFRSVMSVVCQSIVSASHFSVAEMTKSVENSIRHTGIVLANQLADAYPHQNIREVLELAATKWNINLYIPSFGTGGYCIPLSSQYLVAGAAEAEHTQIPLLQEVIRSDVNRAMQVSAQILPGQSTGKIGVFGIAYKEDTTVTKNAPSLLLIDSLVKRGFQVYVCDPEIGDERVKNETGCEIFSECDTALISQFDAIIYNTAHSCFGDLAQRLNPYLRESCLIYDGTMNPQTNWPVDRHKIIGTPSWSDDR